MKSIAARLPAAPLAAALVFCAALAASLLVAGCAAARPADDRVDQLALGRQVFASTCTACHSIDPPALAAPPMSHVARHYLAGRDSAAAARRIADWIAAPSAAASLLPAHAIETYGLMPPLPLSSRERRAVAAYVLTLNAGAHDDHGEHGDTTARAGMGAGMGAGRGAGGMGGMGMGAGRGAGGAGGMGMGAGRNAGGMGAGGMGGGPHRHGADAAVDQAAQQEVTRIGDTAAAALRAGLIQRLSAALQEGGPVAGIEVCADEALVLTARIAADLGDGVDLKRTSLKVRNPRNAPDALEQEALAWFDAEELQGRRPERLVQLDTAGGFRYYAPLRTAALCLNCHGPAASLEPEVAAALQRRYPDDRATGYAEGDLRGLIRVRVPAAALR
jgi:mono/diheme cytochrome c family protein